MPYYFLIFHLFFNFSIFSFMPPCGILEQFSEFHFYLSIFFEHISLLCQWLLQVLHYTYIMISLLMQTFYQFKCSKLHLTSPIYNCFNISSIYTENYIRQYYILSFNCQKSFKDSREGKSTVFTHIFGLSVAVSSFLIFQNSFFYHFLSIR